jgi:hypothetical protein
MGSLLNVIIRSEECRKKKKTAHMATSMSHTQLLFERKFPLWYPVGEQTGLPRGRAAENG